jgi:hypothetical protein
MAVRLSSQSHLYAYRADNYGAANSTFYNIPYCEERTVIFRSTSLVISSKTAEKAKTYNKNINFPRYISIFFHG